MKIMIERWGAKLDSRPFLAPELCGTVITGYVYNHPDQKRFYDGKRITTSILVDSIGRVVITKSGSRYTLGTPQTDYLNYLNTNGIKYDYDNPIKVTTKQEAKK